MNDERRSLKNKQMSEEDYLVRATVTVEGSQIEGIPCKVFLPERIEQKPYIVFKPSMEEFFQITKSYKCELNAIISGFDKSKEVTIESPEVYFSGSSIRNWGGDLSEYNIPGEPQDLHVIRHLKGSRDEKDTEVVLWISPNKLLTPFTSRSSSYTGELKYKRVRNVEFLMRGKNHLAFEQHFRSKTTENGDLVQWSFLVACLKTKISADNATRLKQSILPDIDDFLLIASFGSRYRTACLGWHSGDQNSYTKFYRGNYSFPKFSEDQDIDSGLVAPEDFEDFVHICYSEFLKFENKLALRDAINSLLPLQSNTLETSFLKLFSGLEALVLNFRRSNDLEFVLQQNEWSSLKKYIKKCIKRSTQPTLQPEQRASLYRKLDELNRVSLREAFNLFCEQYSIELWDLWPVFSNDEYVGLVEIRNRLSHGDSMTRDTISALVVAKQHLQFILERIIVVVLKWDIEKTKVRPSYLREHMTAIQNMPAERKKISAAESTKLKSEDKK